MIHNQGNPADVLQPPLIFVFGWKKENSTLPLLILQKPSIGIFKVSESYV